MCISDTIYLLFQKFDILPFTIRVDYSPCHVDLAALSGGKYVELVNLFPWKVISSPMILIFLLSALNNNTKRFIHLGAYQSYKGPCIG